MKKRRPVLGVLFAVVAAVLFVRSCGAVGVETSAALIAHAAYTGNTTTLTQAQTLALFGQTIDVTYYESTSGGNYQETTVQATFARNDSLKTGAANNLYYSPEGQNFEGRQIVTYSFQHPNSTSRPNLSSIKLKTSIDISGLAYLDTGLVQWVSGLGSQNVPASPAADALYSQSTYNDYWHTSAQTFFPLHRGASGTADFNLYGMARSNWGNGWGVLTPAYVNRDALSAFSFGYANCNWLSSSTYTWWEFSIICPILSDNWAYSGNQGAGDYDPNSSSGGGSDGGADMSGVESRLDTIIAQLDAIYAEMQDDDESSGGGSDSVAGLDSTPDNYDFDAAFVAAEPDFQVPTWIVTPESSGSSSPAVPDFETPATTQASAPSISDIDISGGASGVWGVLSLILGAVPWFAPVAMFSLALSIAGYFLFRGGGN